MDRKRRLALIFATIGIALGAGQIVQNGADVKRQAAAAAITPTAITQVSAGPTKPAAVLPAQKPLVVATPAPVAVAPPAPVVLAALTDPVLPAPAPKPAPQPAPVAEACPVTLDLAAEANAMIGVTLMAPCAPSTRVVLRHAGLAITGKTSVTGALFVSLPALDAKGEVSATLKGVPAVTSAVAMPDLADLRRFGVQWQDADAFQVHAFENGAGFNDAGHVSVIDPHKPALGAARTGGYLTVLGDASVTLPMLAEVYTYPATGKPEIVVEAAVTSKTCGRELLAETLTSAAGAAVTMDLTLATPDCTAIGDILVLNNLVSDPTMVAAN
jgi:hypothetical protein